MTFKFFSIVKLGLVDVAESLAHGTTHLGKPIKQTARRAVASLDLDLVMVVCEAKTVSPRWQLPASV
jgi:hypothetical protein